MYVWLMIAILLAAVLLSLYLSGRIGPTSVRSVRFGSKQATHLRPQDVTRLHRALKVKGFGAGRILKVHRVLTRALNVAVRWELVERNVAAGVSPPRVLEKEPDFYSPEKNRTLIEHLGADPWGARWVLALSGSAKMKSWDCAGTPSTLSLAR